MPVTMAGNSSATSTGSETREVMEAMQSKAVYQ